MTEDEIMDQMIIDGDMEIVGLNQDGEPLHKLTEQGIANYPEFFQQVTASVNEFLMKFWQAGYVDIVFSKNEESVALTEKFIAEYPDWPLLEDDEEREFAHELARLFRKDV